MSGQERDERIKWSCSVCLYVRPHPDADPDELDLLTVINGQMVCLWHASCALSDHHSTIRAGVNLESKGTMTSLEAYQEWRDRQDEVDR